MLDIYRPEHLETFAPGAIERELIGGLDLASMMAEYPTVTVLDGGEPYAFLGLRPFNGAMHVWSMWSAEARAHPLRLARFLKLHARWLMEMHGSADATVITTNADEARLAEWLGWGDTQCLN